MLSSIISDIVMAVAGAFLTVCVMGIILAVGFAWEAFLSWVFGVPRS